MAEVGQTLRSRLRPHPALAGRYRGVACRTRRGPCARRSRGVADRGSAELPRTGRRAEAGGRSRSMAPGAHAAQYSSPIQWAIPRLQRTSRGDQGSPRLCVPDRSLY